MDSEFIKQWGIKGKLAKQRRAELEEAWGYVGRFMWGFALVESTVNEIFVTLFNFNAAASLMFVGAGNLDLRKKIMFIKLGLSHQGIDQSKLKPLSRVHELHTFRNVIAHCAFGPDEKGIDFDYVDSSGELALPKNMTEAKMKDTIAHTYVTYSKLNSFDKQFAELWDALEKLLASIDPIINMDVELRNNIEKIIESSDNVYRFPRLPTKSDDK